LNPHERSTLSEFEEESSLIRSFGWSRHTFSDADGGINVTKGSMMILKGERTTNLYNLTGNIIIGDASAATENDTIRL